jgi:alcohol dehydrogenase class IV
MVTKLREEIGIPTRLRDIGVKEEMLPGIRYKGIRDQAADASEPTDATVRGGDPGDLPGCVLTPEPSLT